MRQTEKAFFKIIKKWLKPLLIIFISTVLLVLFVSSPIITTPLYESSVVLYPSATNSISKVLLNEANLTKQDVLTFGQDEQTEQMMQVLQSNTIREKVINNFNLVEHYKIRENSKYFYTKLYNKFKSNVKVRRTRYSAIEIRVTDRDPQMAADIANNIAELVDTVYFEMQQKRAVQGLNIVEQSYNSLVAEVNHMNDSLSFIRSKGVNDYETQSEMVNQEMAKAIANNNQNAVRALKKQLDTIAKYGSAYVSLRDALEYKQEQLSLLKKRYEEAKVDANQAISQTFIVEKAYKAEKKAYPNTWLNLCVITFFVMFFAVVVILFIEKYSSAKNDQTQNPNNLN